MFPEREFFNEKSPPVTNFLLTANLLGIGVCSVYKQNKIKSLTLLSLLFPGVVRTFKATHSPPPD
jgi:hypothetical protein